MRLPSGAGTIPCTASMPVICLTTLLVAGSIMWIVSPAKFVWMIRSCAAMAEKDTTQRTAPVNAANACLILMFVILSGLTFLSHHERFNCLPGGIVLGLELLPAAMGGIPARLFGE